LREGGGARSWREGNDGEGRESLVRGRRGAEGGAAVEGAGRHVEEERVWSCDATRCVVCCGLLARLSCSPSVLDLVVVVAKSLLVCWRVCVCVKVSVCARERAIGLPRAFQPAALH